MKVLFEIYAHYAFWLALVPIAALCTLLANIRPETWWTRNRQKHLVATALMFAGHLLAVYGFTRLFDLAVWPIEQHDDHWLHLAGWLASASLVLPTGIALVGMAYDLLVSEMQHTKQHSKLPTWLINPLGYA